jgi:hypothetical protein
MSPQAVRVRQHARAMQSRIEAMHQRARQACQQAAHVRWQASLTCQRAQRIRLGRHMPGANSLTRAITATILVSYGLWSMTPHHR